MTGLRVASYGLSVTSTAALPRHVEAMLDPAFYAHRPDSVELVQTHISFVLLAGDRVYKVKKPVDFGFIDQVSLEARRLNCEREVRLNRRLSRGVYLGVQQLVEMPDGRHLLRPDTPPHAGGPTDAGTVVEYVVEMSRLPEDRTLAALLSGRGVPGDLMQRLAERLLDFHGAARVIPFDPAYAGQAAQLSWWGREKQEAAPFIGTTWATGDAQALSRAVASLLDRDGHLFDERLEAGRVVDGHGDLHAQHVYLVADEVQIVDCLEFTDWFQFRIEDVGYDLAFLAMDLEARGHRDLGDELAGRYIAASGDETISVLQPLHRAFRAFVRGKIESLSAHAPEIAADQQAEHARAATRYFALATRIINRRSPPLLVVLAGLSGSGKSLVGATLAARIGAAYLSSDIVRKALAGLPLTDRVPAARLREIYGPRMNERTYRELGRRARSQLAAGRPVVLDATHGRRAGREETIAMAQEFGVPALLAELVLPDEEALTRLKRRSTDPLAISDATPAVRAAQRRAFEPISEREGVYLRLNAGERLGRLVDRLETAGRALLAPESGPR